METCCINVLNVKDYTITFKDRNTTTKQKQFFFKCTMWRRGRSYDTISSAICCSSGKPRYTIENIDDIDYLTGTRIYKVHSRKEHIPRQITLFGRQIQCIYTKQPEQQAWIEKQKQEQERKNRDSLNPDNNIESDHGNRNSDEIEAEQNDQKPDIVTEPEQDNQKYIEKQNNTDNKTLKTNMNQTTSRIKNDLPRWQHQKT